MIEVSALPSHHPEDDPSDKFGSPLRTVTVLTDDLGITIQANLRITGVVSEVRDLFESTPPAKQADVLEKAIIIGATNLATVADISATDATRMRLEHSADRLMAAHETVLERQAAQAKAITEKIDNALTALRTQVDSSSRQEATLRKQIKEGQEELSGAAKQLNTSRNELETKVTEAVAKLVENQTKSKEEVVKGTEAALKKLMDGSNPASAPALITGIMDKAAADMRTTTSKNIDGLVKELTKQFGGESPLVEKIARTVREGAEAEIKRVEEQVTRLREELLERRTREEHSPNLRGESYEDDLLELFSVGAGIYGWTVDRTGTATGNQAGSKKGDHLLTDENDQKVAAIEARARKGVSAREFYEGAVATADNRGTKVIVYCAASVDDLPSGLGKFSRGFLPFSYKRVGDGVHVLATVIDPAEPAVIERLAVVLWLVDRMHNQRPERGNQHDAVDRIAQALPWVQQLTERLRSFRTIKSGLTKTAGELGRVADTVTEVEAKITSDLKMLEQVLWGDHDEAATPEVQ